VELYLHSPSMPSLRGAQLKHRDFTFYFTYTGFCKIFPLPEIVSERRPQRKCATTLLKGNVAPKSGKIKLFAIRLTKVEKLLYEIGKLGRDIYRNYLLFVGRLPWHRMFM
jgi:hypothetical protein